MGSLARTCKNHSHTWCLRRSQQSWRGQEQVGGQSPESHPSLEELHGQGFPLPLTGPHLHYSMWVSKANFSTVGSWGLQRPCCLRIRAQRSFTLTEISA